MQRGEVWWASLPPPFGRRPVLLLSRSAAYGRLNAAVAAVLTTRVRASPSMVRLDPSVDRVPQRCVVNLDQMQNVRFNALTEWITRLSAERMAEVEDAIHFALGLRR